MGDNSKLNLAHLSAPQWLILGGGLCVFVGLIGIIVQVCVDTFEAPALPAPVGNLVPATTKISVDSEAIATERMRQFLYATSSGKENLSSFVADRKEQLAWVKDAVLLSELEWQLVKAMMQEGLLEQAGELVNELFLRVDGKPNDIWSLRMEVVANEELAHGSKVKAANWFGKVAKAYAELNKRDDMVRCLSARADATMLSGQLKESRDALLALYVQTEKMGSASAQLQAKILIELSHLSRALGQYADAKAYSEKGLALWSSGNIVSGTALVCYGESLLNAGKLDEARVQLLAGLKKLTGQKEELNFYLAGLRALAQIATDQKDADVALSYINQAEGAARCNISRTDAFWSCLYEQRGWIYLMQEKPALALQDFQTALENGFSMAMKVQAQEGIGCSFYLMGKKNEAIAVLSDTVKIRQAHMASDIVNLERVQKVYAEMLVGLEDPQSQTFLKVQDEKQSSSSAKTSTKRKRRRY